jgi:hypothetical protein
MSKPPFAPPTLRAADPTSRRPYAPPTLLAAAPLRYCRIESTSSIDETEFPRMTWGRVSGVREWDAGA